MKMVKSLLLGTAAGLVAMSGAQAADLPVKAKPVQYVKICSLYGAGFYYIPGTDTCLKVGGFVRTEWNWNANGSFGQNTAGSNALYTRSGQQLFNRSRAIMTMDTRSQTDYGTLRSYFRAGWQWTSGDYQVGGSQGGSSLTAGTTSAQNSSSFNGAGAGFAGSSSTTYFDRAFIQIAGFTFGKTQSFFDFFNTGAYSMQTNFLWVDTGGNGTPVLAYTAQFGNGLTATLSIEDQTEQRLPVVAVGSALTNATGTNNTALFAPGSSNPTQNAGYIVPDLIGNLRVDQAWGSAQVMGALHSVRAAYYNSSTVVGATSSSGAGNTAHPSDAWGYALGAGLTINLPMLGKGDTISGMATYCHGASRYCMAPSAGVANSGAMFGLRNGSTLSGGWADDAYFDGNAANGGSLQLPNAYSLVAGINHFWTPTFQQSLVGGYVNYKTNSSIVDSTVCAATGGGTTNGSNNTSYTFTGSLGAGCANWSAWNLSSRLQWTPVANLDVGLEVMYIASKTGFAGATRAGSTGTPAVLTMGNTNVWSAIFRVQRNFWP